MHTRLLTCCQVVIIKSLHPEFVFHRNTIEHGGSFLMQRVLMCPLVMI